jgi:hypothetical protein
MSDCSLQSLVPSLEVCQSLKAAGFPQDTALCWKRSTVVEGNPTSVHIRLDADEEFVYGDFFEIVCAAPTAEEILEKLPRNVDMKQWVRVNQFYDGYGVEIRCGGMIDGRGVVVHTGPHLVDNLATAYLWWKEQE